MREKYIFKEQIRYNGKKRKYIIFVIVKSKRLIIQIDTTPEPLILTDIRQSIL